ncbi:TetR/AcrR family transcriptional regulator [Falsiroseomonas tokyonensis]|uniref:TetR/AcrR family transcriptional regulator n=1 Tax=Falsiroseomonas tokyonensis TaxID=430521 RepID=A0ABV7BW78_9PROT|nr:TetR/AcrR family transcriptional regulator [Falsiroseomonas tokyonensis]MBU8539129.1 TetR/AcrR family transcriptional regulator [Falsiroseomonas tokyonensis]
MEHPSRKAGRKPSKALDAAILSAALEALAEVGFEPLSIADVARRAGTTPPAIYRRFSNKPKLLLAALADDLAKIRDPATDCGSLRADLLDWIGIIVRELSPSRMRILGSLVFQARRDPEPIALLTETAHRLGARHWDMIITRAVRRGDLPSRALPAVFRRLPAALVTYQAMFPRPPEDAEAIAELVDAVMLPAILAAARPGARTERSGVLP